MFPEFSAFTVEIKNLRFTTDDGRKYPKTAILTLISPDGHSEFVEMLGYVDEKWIFDRIDKEEPLVLDHCLIEKLSLADYRFRKGKDVKHPVNITQFSARSAFFNNKGTLDLSNAVFSGGEVSFEQAYFAKSSLNMHGIRVMDGGINFSYVHFPSGHLDFRGMHVEKGEVSFKNAIFGVGWKDFHDASFGDGITTFANTEFGDGDVTFINTQFGNGNVSFKIARFGTGKIDFHYAKFRDGYISFERTEFGDGRVDFRTAEFHTGRINFNRAVFGEGDVSFEASALDKGKISFRRTQFGEGVIDFELAEFENVDANFDRAVFGEGSISFRNARFGSLSLASCHLDYYLDLRLAHCRHIDLSDTVARDIIDIKPYDFNLDIGTINFSGMRLIGRIFIDWTQNKVKRLIYDQTDTGNKQKAEQFRVLKENFRVTGQYRDEDKAYVEFKRLESKSVLEESVSRKRLSSIWMYPLYWFKLVVLDWAGLYATNPVRVMITMLACYTFFSIVFMLLSLFTSADIVSALGDPDRLGLVAKSFYHSAITFLTIGYGDYYPSGFIRWISSAVGFTGLFLMSYFTVAFVRKILR
jgi:hypothetical protein